MLFFTFLMSAMLESIEQGGFDYDGFDDDRNFINLFWFDEIICGLL